MNASRVLLTLCVFITLSVGLRIRIDHEYRKFTKTDYNATSWNCSEERVAFMRLELTKGRSESLNATLQAIFLEEGLDPHLNGNIVVVSKYPNGPKRIAIPVNVDFNTTKKEEIQSIGGFKIAKVDELLREEYGFYDKERDSIRLVFEADFW